MYFLVSSILTGSETLLFDLLTLRGVDQLVMLYIYSLEVISTSLTNIRATGGLHGH